MTTITKTVRKIDKSIRQTVSFKNMTATIGEGNKLTETDILKYASCLADDGKIPECLEVICYAVKIFQVTMTEDKIIPVVTKLIGKLRSEVKLEMHSSISARNILSCRSCGGVLINPITIACGHTVCKQCLSKNDDTSSIICNVCHIRYATIEGREYCTNILITSLVAKFWENEVRVASLRTKGKKLFLEKKWEESLKIYTEALNLAHGDSLLLSNRSQVLLTLKRPEEALKDANAVYQRRPLWAEGHFHRAAALLALKRDEEAQVAMLLYAALENSEALPRIRREMAKMLMKLIHQEYSSDESLRKELFKSDHHQHNGLSESPQPGKYKQKMKTQMDILKLKKRHLLCGSKSHASLTRNLPVSEAPIMRRIIVKFNSELKHCKRKGNGDDRAIDFDKIVKSDFECTLCYQYFWQPVTTPCGHTFCRSCLDRSLDHTPTCPLCKSSLVHYLAERCFQTTEFIEEVMKRYLPKDYGERKEQYEKELSDFYKPEEIPVFVATVAIPGIVCPLHVYEPRYRLMIRRSLEMGSKQFGMCMPSETEENGYASYGTMLQIKAIKYTPDGRSVINTVGARRFKCISKGMKDGYNTAVVEVLKDDQVKLNSLEDLQRLHNYINLKAKAWFLSIEKATQNRILDHYGPMPLIESRYWELEDGPLWLWWLIAVLPLEPQIQVKIISQAKLRSRLDLINRTLRCIFLHESSSKSLSSSAS